MNTVSPSLGLLEFKSASLGIFIFGNLVGNSIKGSYRLTHAKRSFSNRRCAGKGILHTLGETASKSTIKSRHNGNKADPTECVET